MPYLRLYAPDLPIEQKRVISQKLIEITLRAFKLRANQRYQTSVQFVTQPQVSRVHGLKTTIPRDADLTLEVLSHDLTEEKKKAFVKEATAMLTHLVPVRPWSRVVRLLGMKADSPQQVALQFHELSSAVSDPFVANPQRRAA
jgi:hypothetical protein